MKKNLQFFILEMEKHQKNAPDSCINMCGFVRSNKREKQEATFIPQLVDDLLNQKSFSF